MGADRRIAGVTDAAHRLPGDTMMVAVAHVVAHPIWHESLGRRRQDAVGSCLLDAVLTFGRRRRSP